MKLTGSRSTGTQDAFSDWDYVVDADADFEDIRTRIGGAVAWQFTAKGPLRIATLIDQEGVLWDFTGLVGQFDEAWQAIADAEADPNVGAYWVFVFKFLKGLHRGYVVLGDVGIEMTTALARDIYLARTYGIEQYKDFYFYKALAARIDADEGLCAVTGLPYRTQGERLAKIVALNRLVAATLGEAGRAPLRAFDARLAQVCAAPKR